MVDKPYGSGRRVMALAASVLLVAAICATQARTADRSLTFSAGVEMVNLTVTVTDGGDRLVTGLEPGDFQVFEDGVPQQLTLFSRDRVPISLSLLMDVSSSMQGKLSTAQEAALRLVGSLQDGDAVQLVHFNDRASIVMPFTTDLAAASEAIRTGNPAGATALHTALYIALKDLTKRRSPHELQRQAVVVLSDGEDTTSVVSEDQVMDLARKANISVYGISLRPRATLSSGDLAMKRGAFFLPELSRATGGLTHFPAGVGQLDGVYDRIAEELRTQYNVGYVSTNPARGGEWRKIAIRTPSNPGLQLRYKPGYFAAR